MNLTEFAVTLGIATIVAFIFSLTVVHDLGNDIIELENQVAIQNAQIAFLQLDMNCNIPINSMLRVYAFTSSEHYDEKITELIENWYFDNCMIGGNQP